MVVIEAMKLCRGRIAVYGQRDMPSLLAAMSPKVYEELDAYLVNTSHPLAFQPGPKQYRFEQFMKEVYYNG